MYFDIDSNTGFYYEGASAPSHPIISNPHTSRAVLISNDSELNSVPSKISEAHNA